MAFGDSDLGKIILPSFQISYCQVNPSENFLVFNIFLNRIFDFQTLKSIMDKYRDPLANSSLEQDD